MALSAMNPFLKVMQLFLMMTGTVLGMLLLLLVTPDLEDTMLRAVGRYHRNYRLPDVAQPPPLPGLADNSRQGDGGHIVFYERTDVRIRGRPITVEVDRRRKTFTPWPYSEECRLYHVHFARQKSLPMTALVSFPGSGNTWVRYLLETSSGVFTGSVYTDRQIIVKGFYGEAVPPDCGCTVVQKTHGFSLTGLVPNGVGQRVAEVRLFRGRGILLVRNPYEALLSYRNFLYGGHTGFAPHNQFKGPDWERFASQLAVVWRDLAATWINYTRGREAMVLHFEMLRLDPRHDLRRLLDYLGIAVDERRLNCVLNHVDGPFRRPMSSQQLLFNTRDPFSQKLHKLLDSVIHELDDMLSRRGWGRVPVHLYKFYRGNMSEATPGPM